jgi:hypothetical protein
MRLLRGLSTQGRVGPTPGEPVRACVVGSAKRR